MTYKLEKIQKINKAYVKDNCTQVMIPYRSSYLTVIGDDIKYHAPEGGKAYINSYLKDIRRFGFPYSNVPSHRERKGNIIFNYVNQIYKFDKPYVLLKDGGVFEDFVVKVSNGNSAIIIHKDIEPIFISAFSNLNTDELEEVVNEEYDSIDRRFIFRNGGFLVSEEEFYYRYNDTYQKKLLTVSIKGEERDIKGYNIIKRDSVYDLELVYFPLRKYDESSLKDLGPYAPEVLEPNIRRIYNLSIPKEDIIKAKTMAAMKRR